MAAGREKIKDKLTNKQNSNIKEKKRKEEKKKRNQEGVDPHRVPDLKCASTKIPF